jgi:hypothetical protein
MKTLLLCAAAALLVSTVAADATKVTISFDGRCDVYTLASQKTLKGTWSAVSMGTGCHDGFGYGAASQAQSLGSGNFINMGMVRFGDPDLYTLQVQSPLVTGNAWYVFESTDGINFTEIDSGTYTVTRAPSIHPRDKPAIAGH